MLTSLRRGTASLRSRVLWRIGSGAVPCRSEHRDPFGSPIQVPATCCRWASISVSTIRAWHRNVSPETTNVCAEIDLEMKAGALALRDEAEPGPTRPWKENNGLMTDLTDS